VIQEAYVHGVSTRAVDCRASTSVAAADNQDGRW